MRPQKGKLKAECVHEPRWPEPVGKRVLACCIKCGRLVDVSKDGEVRQ